MHLASLRGNTSVVEYLVKDCKMNVSLKDSSGATALAVAMKKEMLDVEWVLRQNSTQSLYHLINDVGLARFLNSKRFFICFHFYLFSFIVQ